MNCIANRQQLLEADPAGAQVVIALIQLLMERQEPSPKAEFGSRIVMDGKELKIERGGKVVPLKPKKKSDFVDKFDERPVVYTRLLGKDGKRIQRFKLTHYREYPTLDSESTCD